MIQPASITILNVDRDDSRRAPLSHLLTLRGFVVKEKETGEAAFHCAKTERPDVILLGLDLNGTAPDVDSFEACRRLKADPSTFDIPVVQLSAEFTQDQLLIRGYQSGASSCMVSPVNPDVLKAVVESLVQGRRQQEQLQLGRKLEATGRLTLKAAQRFGNVTMGLLGDLGLAAESLTGEGGARPFLKSAAESANRIAELSKDLFAGGGGTSFVVERLNLSEVVRGSQHRITAALPASIQLNLELQQALPLVYCDASRIQNLLLQLVRNAAEAIGDEPAGTITIRSTADNLDELSIRDYIGYEDIQPGPYVFLQVEDSGCGMDENIKGKMFDPFFSTKKVGLGLGLTTVLETLRRHQGGIRVASVAGKGTRITVCLAAAEQGPGPE